ncbi:hypothetical protein CSUI_009491 [Cystoisospora suis]|uniref:SRS domain-containing protein n=1 Tax=Cystoisospora suis TaxID=483139 RepID=A0A2C6KJX3_9APIC|nr:hypothetical protein CSUI_009491 [Cystoisospora suis]
MKLVSVCLSSAVAALATTTSAVSAGGADVAALFSRKSNLSEEGNHQLQADPRRLSGETSVTCKDASKVERTDLTATFSEAKLQASFTCGGTYVNGLLPREKATQCFRGPTETAGVEISSVLGVNGKVSTSGNTHTVTLQKILDDKRDQKIYYRCTSSKGADQDFCLVTLSLPKIGPNECAIDKALTFSLGKTASSAKFKCAGGQVSSTAFEVSKEGMCTNVQKQTKAVKLAEVGTETKEYQLTVDELPNQTEQLCYTCTYTDVPSLQDNNQTTTRTCSVIVTVEAAASSTSTATTTSSAQCILTTSGAMNLFVAMFLIVAASN